MTRRETYSVCYRTYETVEEARKAQNELLRANVDCIVASNPDTSNPYALWAVWIKPLR